MRISGNPLDCCSLAWLHVQGINYGVHGYKEQVDGPGCSIGDANEFDDLWDMTCGDFSLCSDEALVTACDEAREEPLPATTTTEAPEMTTMGGGGTTSGKEAVAFSLITVAVSGFVCVFF